MNREDDQFIGGQFSWFTGVVEDIVDDENLGRVRVRCFGYHTDDKNIIQTADLPWATVMGPTTSAGVQGIGTTHRLLSGSWVVGFFRDGPSAQDPLIMGSIASQSVERPDPDKGFTGDYPTEAGLDMPLAAQFRAHNTQVIHTPGGHTIELDDSIDEETITVTHKSGSTLTFNQDGTIALDSFNDVITLDGNTSITGTLSVSGAAELASTLDVTAALTAQATITATGSITGNGIVLDTHTHSGSEPPGSQGPKPTGKPIA